MEQHTFKPPCGRRFRFKRIIFLFCIGLILNSCLTSINHIEKETFYIPKGVTGKIYILFNCKDGKPKKWINGRRLYEIPPSGVLKTQFKENTGHLIIGESENEKVKKFREYAQFFYVDENYKPTQQINYSPYYSPEYRKFFKKNQVNISGTNSVIGFSNSNNKYDAAFYNIFSKDSIDYKKFNLIKRSKKDWYRINNWNIYDMRKDSIK